MGRTEKCGLACDRARRKRRSACPGPIELRSMGTQSLAQTTSYSGFSLHSQDETDVAVKSELFRGRSLPERYALAAPLKGAVGKYVQPHAQDGRGAMRHSSSSFNAFLLEKSIFESCVLASSTSSRYVAICLSRRPQSTGRRRKVSKRRFIATALCWPAAIEHRVVLRPVKVPGRA